MAHGKIAGATDATRLTGQSAAEENSAGSLAIARQFVREHWLRIAAISVLVLVPCYWHREIEADDLLAVALDELEFFMREDRGQVALGASRQVVQNRDFMSLGQQPLGEK